MIRWNWASPFLNSFLSKDHFSIICMQWFDHWWYWLLMRVRQWWIDKVCTINWSTIVNYLSSRGEQASQLSLPVVCWLLLVALDAEVVEVEVLLALAGVAGGPGLLGRLRSRGVRSSRCRTKSHDWLCEVWLHNIWVTKLATECLKFWGSPNPT